MRDKEISRRLRDTGFRWETAGRIRPQGYHERHEEQNRSPEKRMEKNVSLSPLVSCLSLSLAAKVRDDGSLTHPLTDCGSERLLQGVYVFVCS